MRSAVEQTTGCVDQPNMLHFPGVFGALEHHVFEKMRETAASARLETKADLIVNADGDDGRGMIGRRNDAQAVGEFGVLDRNMQFLQLFPPVDFFNARFN